MGIVAVIPLYCSTHKARDKRRRRRRKEPKAPPNTVLDEWRCQSPSPFTHARQILSMLHRERQDVRLLIVAWQKASRIHGWGTKAALRLHLYGRLSSTLVRWVTGQRARNDCTVRRKLGLLNNSRRVLSIDWHRAVCWLCACQSSPPPSQHCWLRYYPTCLFISSCSRQTQTLVLCGNISIPSFSLRN